MDPIANMIIQLKNAGEVRKESVVFSYSKIKMAILEQLLQSGFVSGVTKKGKKVVKYIEVTLAYNDDKSPKITGVKRISKNSKRIYMKAKDIRPVRSGYGILVLSSPKGIITDEVARKEMVGGEALFTMW